MQTVSRFGFMSLLCSIKKKCWTFFAVVAVVYMCVRVDVVLVEQVSAAEAILMSKCEWKFVFRTRCALAATSSCILWVVVCWCCWCCWHHPYVYFCICRICANSACFAVGSYFFSIGSFFFLFYFQQFSHKYLPLEYSHWMPFVCVNQS